MYQVCIHFPPYRLHPLPQGRAKVSLHEVSCVECGVFCIRVWAGLGGANYLTPECTEAQSQKPGSGHTISNRTGTEKKLPPQREACLPSMQGAPSSSSGWESYCSSLHSLFFQ